MTLTELRSRTADLISYEGVSTAGVDASGSVLDTAINWGQDQISHRLYMYSGYVTFTVAASDFQYDVQDTGVFSKRMLSIDRVVIGGTILRDHRGQYGLFSLAELDAWYPAWRATSNGTPVAAAFADPNLYLTPPPTGTIANCFVQGRHLADALTTSGQVSELPIQVHELIPCLAAHYLQSPVLDTEDGWRRVAQYRADADSFLNDLYIRQYMAVHGRMPITVPGGPRGAE